MTLSLNSLMVPMFISLSKHLGWYIFCIFVLAMNNSALIFPSFSRVHVPFLMADVFPRVYYMHSCTLYSVQNKGGFSKSGSSFDFKRPVYVSLLKDLEQKHIQHMSLKPIFP